MKTATSLLEVALKGECNSRANLPPEWIVKAVNYVFAKMAIKYESTYMRTWPTTDDEDLSKRNWVDEINKSDLSKEAVKNGIDRMSENYRDWPPNLNGFINLCKKKDCMALEAQSFKSNLPRLPKKPTEDDFKKGKSALAGMRSKLR